MQNPIVRIDEKGASFLRSGQMWMFRNNLVASDQNPEDGSVVDIETEAGEYLGTGFYSRISHIAVRIMTHHRGTLLDEAFFLDRIRKAWQYRRRAEPDNLDNIRILFGDGDGIGGLTADRYGTAVVTQILSAGIEKRKNMIYGCLLKVLQEDGQDVRAVYERNDVKSREKEGLPLYKGFWKDRGTGTDILISENGLRLKVDIENGQKTGYFLDQKSNRLLIRNFSSGMRVLDCFTHTGGFALNAAKGNALYTEAVDISGSALEEARLNAELNGLESKVNFVQADVFDYLERIRPGQFDLIILDPPAFTKSRRTIDHAYQGYLRINRMAMNILRNGGYLATCSCSRYMENDLFEKMLREAAADEHVVLREISVTRQNADHPIIWTMAETSYLKFYLFQILEEW